MKTPTCLATCLLVLSSTTALAQSSTPASDTLSKRAVAAEAKQKADEAANTLTTFNLDFPGGTPKELVAAIQTATGKPLNAIIPAEAADVKLPPLKMNNVDVPELFKALERASYKSEAVSTGGRGGGFATYQMVNSGYYFRTEGPLSDDSVWYFRIDKSGLPPMIQTKSCRFYLLTPYLDRGLTVDDITTAIQTGWKMQGDNQTPAISFHKETKLLIAVGDPSKLETIDAVLKALDEPAGGGRRGPVGGSGRSARGPIPGGRAAPIVPEQASEPSKTGE